MLPSKIMAGLFLILVMEKIESISILFCYWGTQRYWGPTPKSVLRGHSWLHWGPHLVWSNLGLWHVKAHAIYFFTLGGGRRSLCNTQQYSGTAPRYMMGTMWHWGCDRGQSHARQEFLSLYSFQPMTQITTWFIWIFCFPFRSVINMIMYKTWCLVYKK